MDVTDNDLALEHAGDAPYCELCGDSVPHDTKHTTYDGMEWITGPTGADVRIVVERDSILCASCVDYVHPDPEFLAIAARYTGGSR